MQVPPIERSEEEPIGPISGFDYIMILYEQKWLILGALFLCLLAAYGFIKISVRQFEASVVMVPYTDQSEGSSGLGLGALAGLGGLVSRSATNETRAVALAMLDSRVLLQQFITDNKLLPILFDDRWDPATNNWKPDTKPPTLEDGYNRLHGLMRIEEDPAHNVIRLFMRWTDATVAANWANGLVARVNAKMQARVISEAQNTITYLNEEYNKTTIQELRSNIALLIEDQVKKRMMAKSHDDFALVVIDPAEATEKPASPRTLVIMAGGLLAGLLIGVPLAFFRHGLKLRRRAKRPAPIAIEGRGRQEWRTS